MEAFFGTSTYATVLSWAFLATNLMRVLAYLPTIKRLLHADVTADCQSQLTWLLWAAANLTMALHCFETNHRQANEMILIASGNALMCCICLYLVRRAQVRVSRSRKCAVAMPDLTSPTRFNG